MTHDSGATSLLGERFERLEHSAAAAAVPAKEFSLVVLWPGLWPGNSREVLAHCPDLKGWATWRTRRGLEVTGNPALKRLGRRAGCLGCELGQQVDGGVDAVGAVLVVEDYERLDAVPAAGGHAHGQLGDLAGRVSVPGAQGAAVT